MMIASLPTVMLKALGAGHLEVRLEPPPPRREPIPAPRPGFVWVPGYWDWRNARHSWVVGHWVPERRGYHWRPHRWISRDGRWYLQPGGWMADETVAR